MANKADATKAEDTVDQDTTGAATDSTEDFSLEQELAADNLIKDYVLGAVTASIVPVPLFDIAAVVVIQLRMIQKLSQLYGKPFSEKLARKVIFALGGGVVGYGAGSIVASSAIKLIPGIGWMVGMVSLPAVSGASTYAVGRAIMQHYEGGGSLFDLNASKMRAFYKEQFAKGEELAMKAKEKVMTGDKDISEEEAA